jgi:PAS domain S-box-containing protein
VVEIATPVRTGLLEVMWNSIDTPLAFYGADGSRLMANRAAERFLQDYDANSGTRVIQFADGESLVPDAELPLARALRGQVVRDEVYVIRLDGADHHMTVSAHPIALVDGTTGVLAAFRERSPRELDEQANRTSLAQLSMLLNGAAGYAIMELGPAGEIRSWSQAAGRLLGYTGEEVIGRPYEVLFCEADRADGTPASILNRAAHDGSAQTYGRRVRKDGSSFWSDGALTAIRDRDGRLSAFVKVLHDVTDRHDAEQEIEQLNAELRRVNGELESRVRERTALLEGRTAELVAANAELEAFSYSVSHDLRAPVRAVQGFARIVQERYGDVVPVDARHYLGRITDGAQRMGDLVDALLRLSRMQRKPLATTTVDMDDLVRRSWRALADEYPGHGVQLDAVPLTPANGDAQLLQQVWMNLLDNAVKYSRGVAGARVEVRETVEQSAVTYLVRDNGAGFDPRYGDKLFQAFQRLHREEDYAGIGIGLAIVHRVVLRHGGRVWGEGSPGNGATFGFMLRRTGGASDDVA